MNMVNIAATLPGGHAKTLAVLTMLNNGCVATGEIKRLKAVVCVVFTRTTCTMLTTTVERMSSSVPFLWGDYGSSGWYATP